MSVRLINYSLNGDSNPLHAIPGPGRAMGFDGAIIHGLWTYNAALYALLRILGKSQASSVRRFEAKFASPLSPGDAARMEIWRLRVFDNDGYEEIRFIVRSTGGKLILSNGRALIKTGAVSMKL